MPSVRFRLPMHDDPWGMLAELKLAAKLLKMEVPPPVVKHGELRVVLHHPRHNPVRIWSRIILFRHVRSHRYPAPDGF